MPLVEKAANAHSAVVTGWTNPANAYALTGDDVYATAAPAKNATVSGDFGFPDFTSSDIPDGSTIDGVTVLVEWKLSAVVTGGILGCQGRVNGANSGAEATRSGSTAEVQGTATLGTVTLADLRSASSLVKARLRCARGNTNTAVTGSLDFAVLQVTYSEPPPGISGSGGITSAPSTLAGSGTQRFTGSGGISSPASAVAGSGGQRFTGSGALASPASAIAGEGTVESTGVSGSGGIVSAPSTLAGSGTLRFVGAGAVASRLSAIAGSGSLRFVGSGGIASRPSAISGSGGGEPPPPDNTERRHLRSYCFRIRG